MNSIQPGERLVNFRRLDEDRETLSLYQFHAGEPMVFVVFPPQMETLPSSLIDQLTAPLGVWDKVSRLGLAPTGPAACASFHKTHTLDFHLLTDDGSVCAYLADQPDNVIRVLFTDNNLRMLERWTLDDDPNALSLGDRVEQLYRGLPQSDVVIIRDPAPVLILPRVLDEALCDDLISNFDDHGGQPSGVLHLEDGREHWQPDPEIKIRRDLTLETSELTERVSKNLTRKILPEIKRVFTFDVTRHEPFKLVRYSANTGGYFRPHRDNVTKDVYYRRFAMTINLNDPDSYAGGQLRFPEFGPHLYQPPAGGAIVFSCSLVHEAMDVIQGSRYALLAFFYNEASMKKPGSR